MPDLFYDSIDAVPEGLKDAAVKGTDGKFLVKVVPATKLDEFRTNNINVSKERDDLKKFVEAVKPLVGEDPEAFKARLAELVATDTKVKDGGLKTSEAIASEVENRVAAMRADYEKQNRTLAGKVAEAEKGQATAETRWRQSIIQGAVTTAVIEPDSGALASALPDIMERAYRVFKVDPHTLALVAKEGEATIYGADGATPMTPREWLAKLKTTAPHFFKNSSGGGANGDRGTGGDKRFGGLDEKSFRGLTPEAKLALAHKMKLEGAKK